MICNKEEKACKNLFIVRKSANLLKQFVKQMLYLFIMLFIITALINFGGCCAYSFTGSSVPEHLNSISIPVADDRSGSGESGLREEFTNLLTQKFVDDNSLAVTERVNADAVLETVITSLSD